LFLFLTAFAMLWRHFSPAAHPTRAFRWTTTPVVITATIGFVAIFAAGKPPLFSLLVVLGGASASAALLATRQLLHNETRPAVWLTALAGLPALGAVAYATG